jgi:hypothetical protein
MAIIKNFGEHDQFKECFACKKNFEFTTQFFTTIDSWCRKCISEFPIKGYKGRRARLRLTDEKKYLAHQNKIQRNWVNKNLDHVKKWRTTRTEYRLKGIKDQAKEKGYRWELEQDYACKLMESECVYCGYIDLKKTVNGIDRLDSFGHYTVENCVSACGTCNFMKCCYDPITFISRCRNISGVESFEFPDKKRVSSLNSYKKRAEKKELPFELTNDQFKELKLGKCEYCRKESSKTHFNGVDRIDSRLGYDVSNCVSCCSDCNYMKKDLTKSQFLEKCRKVSEKCDDYLERYKDVKKCLTFHKGK